MDALQAIKTRTSIRKYQDKEIPVEILEDIVDCGRMAPTGYNHQPWIFVVVNDRETKEKLSIAARSGRFIKEAGACIAVFCRKGEETALEDACAATENMIIAAQAYHLGSCWINAYQKSNSLDIKQVLGCPRDYELMTLFTLGYPNEEKTSERKPLKDVLRWNKFE